MSQSLIVDVLFHGLAVAVSPEAIVCVVLILLTQRARTNSLAYLFGWVVGLAVVATIVLVADDLVAGAADRVRRPTMAGIVRLSLGLLLVGLAVRRILRRRRGVKPAGEPKWLAIIEHFGPVRCFVWGFLLSGVNPKNVALNVSGMAHFIVHNRAWEVEVLAIAAFILLASSTIAAPVILYRMLGDRAQPRLERLRGWLFGHADIVLVTLLAIFGVKLIVDGIDNLLA